ncbi:alpha/beta fold hydrolase [Gordonia sp. zg691]|uniref:lipase family protein n=1 Tax=Gordonia jinghuaiqii TaxID=2758710 RepID=UPI001662614C|nr:lipase family protein [Gordonia jinghuaiqii]MBD0862173.1 alpha/beta fold hydrolase [Gordonia jinghuaiqii]
MPGRPPMRIAALVVAVLAWTGLFATAAPAHAAAPDNGFVFTTADVADDQLPTAASAGTRLTYATRDQRGRPAMSSGVYWLPEGTPPAGGWPVVSWAHGTVGVADECAPTRHRLGDGVELPVRAALEAGYAVTATDYAGLGTAGETEYLGGRAAAHSVIDMIRAARSVENTLGARWVSIGHSQGGHAAIQAGRLAPEYAPELPVEGVVAIAPVSLLEELFGIFGPRVPALGALNVLSAPFLYTLAGLDHAHPELRVTDFLTTDGKRFLDRSRSRCNGDLVDALRSVSPGSLVDRSFTDDQSFRNALREYAEVPTSGYPAKVTIAHGILDPVLPYLLSRKLRSAMSDNGVDVDLKTYARADHSSVVDGSLPDVLAAIRQAFGD